MGVRSRYWWAAALGAIGAAAVAVLVLLAPENELLAIVAAASFPLAALLAVQGRLSVDPPPAAIIAGAGIGVASAVLGYGVVFAIAYGVLGGFADAVIGVFETVGVDPALADALGREWLVVLAISVVVVAPITEETGKAVGAIVSRPTSRRAAFVAGVAAGAAFGALEDVMYAVGSGWFSDSAAVVVSRSLGAAVHPLATGLVVLGWWDWRHGGGIDRVVKGVVSGVGVHALWNGSLVVLTAAELAYGAEERPETIAAVSWAYTAAIGVGLAAGLWRVTRSVAADRDPLRGLVSADGWSLAAWVLVTASFLVPVVVLLVAFPGFR
jgi:RsiW-degrading membrane proteinase PrsW (M82 family)